MAYILRPMSSLAGTERYTFPHLLSGGNNFYVEGLGVLENLPANAEHHHLWKLPANLPPGDFGLELAAIAAAGAAGDAKVEPCWTVVAAGASVDLALGSLTSEGVTTVTWTTPDDDLTIKRTTILLDGSSPVADRYLVMRLVFPATSWTLDKNSIWLPALTWV